jgi:lipopolysaccharide export LptBFGC system permease protein LptF
MWKIHRYYLRELSVSVVLVFLVLFGTALLMSVPQAIGRAQGGNLLAAAMITVLYAVDAIPHLLAMAILFATVLTFARASQNREITALRAAGVSPRVPMVAALLVGLSASLLVGYATHYLIPWAHFHKYRVIGDAIRSFYLQTEMSGDRMAFGGFLMTWKSRDENGRFRDVVVKIGSGSGDGEPAVRSAGPGRGVFYADEAWLKLGDLGESIGLQFENMRSLRMGNVGRFTIWVDLRALTAEVRRDESDKDLASDQLLSEVMRGVHENPDGARFTVHRRSSFALMSFLFAPIGFCIGVLARDRGRMTALLFGMVPLVLFYGCVMIAPELVRFVDWPPIGLLPVFVLGLTGIPFCWRLLKL